MSRKPNPADSPTTQRFAQLTRANDQREDRTAQITYALRAGVMSHAEIAQSAGCGVRTVKRIADKLQTQEPD